ncbi:hypothetical protein BDZ85DRAFT_256126 [Elsinoe ampelina]|uniref:Uncharacterized protein n=1 Tax=Elsinoe ampelina TaxID=302913 RepID=A0A6A6GM27_9PEZI|nr:hypothetical protein BDZ85DRAFT_256126 [Elsinoe ampelina]
MASPRPLSMAARPLVRPELIQAFFLTKDRRPSTRLTVDSKWRLMTTWPLSRKSSLHWAGIWSMPSTRTFTHPSTTAWVGTGLSSTVAGSRS